MTNPVQSFTQGDSTASNGTSPKIVFVFSGQGSQTYFMAKELYDSHSGFRGQMNRLDGLFRDALGSSVLDHVYNPRVTRSDPFDAILFSLPATFMVQYAMAQTLIENDVRPHLVVGASLGEMSAAVIAGCVSLADAISAMAAMAQFFDRTRLDGGMTAVLHDLESYRTLDKISCDVELAAINFESNFVVSGTEPGLGRIHQVLLERGIPFQRLPVKQPFHSPLLDYVQDEFHRVIPIPRFAPPSIPMVSCTSGGPIAQLGVKYLWNTIRQPIRTMDVVRSLEQQGSFRYIDMGPGASFGNCIKRILKNGSLSTIHLPLNPFAQRAENLEVVVRTCMPARGADQRAAAAAEPLPQVQHRPESRHAVRIDLSCAYVFPGQGSQYLGMGVGLFDEFQELTEIADRTLGYSIKRLCTQDPDKQLALTQFTQPAVYVVNALSYFKKIQTEESRPGFVAGHSLGEYNALLAAGAFDFETGLRLVRKRGELMSRVAGGMAAVIGLQADAITKILDENGLNSIDIANLNAPEQIVLAGPEAEIRAARPFFIDRGAHYVPLNVSAPFHSRYMQPVKREFAEYLCNFRFSPLSCSVISNVDANPYPDDSLPRLLTEQTCRPVKWTGTICHLLDRSVQHFHEVGPGQVLTKLMALIRRSRP
jgi:malonyl CoA-acyl carrier protein transacylase